MIAALLWILVYAAPWALLTPWGDRLARRATVSLWGALEGAQGFLEAQEDDDAEPQR